MNCTYYVYENSNLYYSADIDTFVFIMSSEKNGFIISVVYTTSMERKPGRVVSLLTDTYVVIRGTFLVVGAAYIYNVQKC